MTLFQIRMAALAGAALTLTACVPNDPIVTGFNEASVEIQQDTTFQAARADDPRVIAEANRICATANRRAEYASTRFNQRDYVATHLFLCLTG